MYVVVNGIKKKYNKITLYRNSILVLGILFLDETCMYEECIYSYAIPVHVVEGRFSEQERKRKNDREYKKSDACVDGMKC